MYTSSFPAAIAQQIQYLLHVVITTFDKVIRDISAQRLNFSNHLEVI